MRDRPIPPPPPGRPAGPATAGPHAEPPAPPGAPPQPGPPPPGAPPPPPAPDARPAAQPGHHPGADTPGHGPAHRAPEALLAGPDLEAVTRRWHEIQAGFVDEPRRAVEDADALVSDLLNRLTQLFAGERRQLESHWSRGDEVSTEELRVSLQRYRAFFQRLLSLH